MASVCHNDRNLTKAITYCYNGLVLTLAILNNLLYTIYKLSFAIYYIHRYDIYYIQRYDIYVHIYDHIYHIYMIKIITYVGMLRIQYFLWLRRMLRGLEYVHLYTVDTTTTSSWTIVEE